MYDPPFFEALEELDRQVTDALAAKSRAQLAQALAHFAEPYDLAMYWALYEFRDRGQTLSERGTAPPHLQPWLEAQRQAVVIVGYVLHDGRLRDLHSGRVWSPANRADTSPGGCLLGRLLNWEGRTLLWSEHPSWLPLAWALALTELEGLPLLRAWDRASSYPLQGESPLEAFLHSGHPRLKTSPWKAAQSGRQPEELEACLREAEEGFPPGHLRFALALAGKGDVQQGMRVEARLVDTSVSRTLELPPRLRLPQFHKVLQLIMGWQEEGHRWECPQRSWGDVDEWEGEVEDERQLLAADLLLQPVPPLYCCGEKELEVELVGLVPTAPASPQCVDGTGPFDRAAVQAALDRRYRKQPKVTPAAEINRAPSEEELAAVFAGLGTPPLESYRLERLKLPALMVAALLEAGRDLSLEELAERLGRAGLPLPHGIESLRKAWKRALPLRETLTGKIGLVRQGYAFSSTCHDLWSNLRAKYPPPPPPPPPAPDVSTPLTVAEVVAWRPSGPGVSRRQKMMAWLDAHGGWRRLSDLAADLGVPEASLQVSLAGRNLAMEREGDALRLDQHRPEVAKVRALVRAQPRPAPPAPLPEYAERSQARRERLQARWREGRRALVHIWLPYAVARDGQGNLHRLSGEEAIRGFLESLDIVIAFDPWTTFERFSIPFGERTMVDLGATRLPLTELLFRTGAAPMATPSQLQVDPFGALEKDLASLRQVHRYGQIHRSIGGREVFWNPGLEPNLRRAVEACQEAGKPLRLRLREGADDFVPREFGRGMLRGIWRGREVMLDSEEVLDFELPAGVEAPPGLSDDFGYA